MREAILHRSVVTRAATALGAVVGLVAFTALALARSDLPITETVLPDGDPRYSVPITIGDGPPLAAMIDTGSFGLRVLASALRPDDYQASEDERRYPFGGGAVFEGVLARAPIGLGDARSSEPVTFQLVRHVSCAETQPDCPASKVSPEDYRMGGDGFAGQGFEALLGLSLRQAPMAESARNPLPALGASAWIIVLPRPGTGETGHLILDPDPSEREGFVTMHLAPAGRPVGGVQGWADAALPGCLARSDGSRKICAGTWLDTGAPGFHVIDPKTSSPEPWPEGTRAVLTLGDGAPPPVSVAFTTHGEWSEHVGVRPARGGSEGRIIAGTLPFYRYEVLYDAQNGTMGFKPRR